MVRVFGTKQGFKHMLRFCFLTCLFEAMLTKKLIIHFSMLSHSLFLIAFDKSNMAFFVHT